MIEYTIDNPSPCPAAFIEKYESNIAVAMTLKELLNKMDIGITIKFSLCGMDNDCWNASTWAVIEVSPSCYKYIWYTKTGREQLFDLNAGRTNRSCPATSANCVQPFP